MKVAGVAEVLDETDPLAVALAALEAVPAPVGVAGRPVDERGAPMLNAREAAERIGKDRSWITRQLNSGSLRGRKVGSEWWIAQAWADAYIARRQEAKVVGTA